MSLMITSLPQDIIIECVSRVPRRYYSTLSLVSKFFRSLIASPQLYARRALMDRTECFLYVTISLTDSIDGHGDRDIHWYTLRRKPNSTYTLVPITSLPQTPPALDSHVAVGSKIFVMGNNASLLIDCRFHTVRNLPNMPKEVPIFVSDLVKGKIYVVGEMHSCRSPFTPQGVKDLMVFDVKTEMWESRTTQDITVCNCDTFWKNVVTWESITRQDVEECNCDRFCKSAVTWDNKVYFRWVGYNPRKDKWEQDEILNSRSWYRNGCVMEGVMYCYSPTGDKLFAYDLKERCWKVVKGVEGLMDVCSVCPRTVIYDTKVLVFFDRELYGKKFEIWCAVIKVERDQKGEICGVVMWCGCVLDNGQWPRILNCSSVDV